MSDLTPEQLEHVEKLVRESVEPDAAAKALAEAALSQQTYGDFASMHEAYGVLAEEVAELFDAVRLPQMLGSRRGDKIKAEAIQVAAVALRIATQAHRVTR